MSEKTETRKTGIIKKMNSNGYGFITSDDIDFFFHYSNIGDGSGANWKKLLVKYTMSGNDKIKVSFDLDPQSEIAPKAVNVVILEN